MFNWQNDVTPLDDTNLNEAQRQLLLACYPVGSYYWADNDTDPSTLFGGTWSRVKDVFLYALGDSGDVGDTGGSETYTLTRDNLPKISGSFTMHGGASATPVSSRSGDFTTDYNNTKYKDGGTEYTGAGSIGNIKLNVGKDNPDAINTLPPYIKAYCWVRTA